MNQTIRHIPIILLFFIMTTPSPQVKAQSPAAAGCRAVLQQYMKRYPASDLCDVYKFCFQDIFGPAHINIDSVQSVKNIEQELAKFKTLGGPDYEYTGCEGNYVRVNISLVRQGTITATQLSECMARSVDPPHPMTVEEWKYRWGRLEEALLHTSPQPGHFALDSESIESLLDRGGYAVHHSYSYNTTYNFHYRVIRNDIFEAELLPIIKRHK